MTAPHSQPDAIGELLLIPDAAPPQKGRVSDRAYKRGYIPKTYSSQELNEARRAIAHWNVTFKGVSGGYRANDEAINIKTYVGMIRKAARNETFRYIDEPFVKAAITAYRNDSDRVRAGRWTRFVNWINCETIDFYRGRIKVAGHRREQAVRVKREDQDLAAAARKIARHKAWDTICIAAAERNLPLVEFLRCSFSGCKDEGGKNAITEMHCVVSDREGLSATVREDLSNRARRVFEVHYSRPIGGREHDQARLLAIELALMQLYPKRLRKVV